MDTARILFGLAAWPQTHGTIEFFGMMLAAIAAAALADRPFATRDWVIMRPSFVVGFTALLLLGPSPAIVVTVTGAVTRGLTDFQHSGRVRRTLGDLVALTLAMLAAGAAHQVLGGTVGQFTWPLQGVPIAAAVVAYCLVVGVPADVLLPLVTRRPVNRSWFTRTLRSAPSYVIGAGLAVGLVEVIRHRTWEVLPVVALPLYLAYRGYCARVSQLEEDYRRREVIDALDAGMSVVDENGRVTLWSDALERILGCPATRALGRRIVDAIPVLGQSELPRALDDALTHQRGRTVARLATNARTVQVKIVPVAGGATLLWSDVTERTRAEDALRQQADRLALAAEGASDGLWEWNLRTQEAYFSGRWRTLIGLQASDAPGRAEEWMDRVHPDDRAPLKAALDAHLAGKTDHLAHEHRIRHEDGSYRQFLCRGVATRSASGRTVRLGGSLTDTTDRATAQDRLRTAEFLDPLTELSNRTMFVDRLGRLLEELKQRRGSTGFAVLYLDLDRFKVVNDSLGHLVGDELLKVVSRRLESCLRPGDALARLGGDEFAILLNGLSDDTQANAIAFRIQDALSAPFSIGGREVFTSASIGIAFGRAQYGNSEEIMRDADTAMYHAKSRGKARHELFDADMHARALDRLGLENDLRHAVNANDFAVHYQPIVSLASGMCVGFESLVRWTRKGEGVSPATFIPIAEELGLIEPIGTWVLRQACATFAEWQRRFPAGGLDFITVNVSSRQLLQHDFLNIVEQAVHHSGLKPCELRLEITETALMDTTTLAAKLLRELRDFGVKIYLDDFGTGYSSLSHLHKLPVDALKIDRSFVRSLMVPDRPAIVESILALARTLNTSVVAEGIESDDEARELQRLGCTHAQGFLFSRPLSTEAAEKIIAAHKPLRLLTVQPIERVGCSVPFEWPEDIFVAG